MTADVDGQAVEAGRNQELRHRQRPIPRRLPAMDEGNARPGSAAAGRYEPGGQSGRARRRHRQLLERQAQLGRRDQGCLAAREACTAAVEQGEAIGERQRRGRESGREARSTEGWHRYRGRHKRCACQARPIGGPLRRCRRIRRDTLSGVSRRDPYDRPRRRTRCAADRRSRPPGAASRGSTTRISSATTPRRHGSPRARWPRSTRRMPRSPGAAPLGRAGAAEAGGASFDQEPQWVATGRAAAAETDEAGHRSARYVGDRPASERAASNPWGRWPRERRDDAEGPGSAPVRRAASRAPARQRPDRPARAGADPRLQASAAATAGRRGRSESSSSGSFAAIPSARSRRSSRPTSTGWPGRSPATRSSWPRRGSSRKTSTAGDCEAGSGERAGHAGGAVRPLRLSGLRRRAASSPQTQRSPPDNREATVDARNDPSDKHLP